MTPTILSEKQRLRKQMREAARLLSEEERTIRSERICREVETMNAFVESSHLLLYYPLPYEVSTRLLLQQYRTRKQLFLPVVEGDRLYLAPYEGESSLRKGAFDVLEPMGKRFTEWDRIDCVIVPAVAFDTHRNRLGYGKGYYDRLLPQLPNAVRIGIGFTHQLVDHLPVEPTDIPMHYTVSG